MSILNAINSLNIIELEKRDPFEYFKLLGL